MSRVVSQILSATDIYVCRLYHTGPGRKLKREGVQPSKAEVWKNLPSVSSIKLCL